MAFDNGTPLYAAYPRPTSGLTAATSPVRDAKRNGSLIVVVFGPSLGLERTNFYSSEVLPGVEKLFLHDSGCEHQGLMLGSWYSAISLWVLNCLIVEAHVPKSKPAVALPIFQEKNSILSFMNRVDLR